MVDKVIISNRAALTDKYSANGFVRVAEAVNKLIQADTGRGLKSEVFWIDDAATMQSVGGKPPVNAKDERGAKAAVDAIAASSRPTTSSFSTALTSCRISC